MPKKPRGSVSEETFDDFLASEGMLEVCEDHALKEVIAEQLTTRCKSKASPRSRGRRG